MMKQKKILLKPFGIFAVLMSAVVFFGGCSSKAKEIDINVNAGASKTGPVQVTAAQAVVRGIPAFIEGTGSFVADETTDVSPKVSGQVVSTSVEVGDFVQRGQVIAMLDDKDARLRLEQSKSAENQAAVAVKQAAARLGIAPNGKFDPANSPEVQSAYQNYLALVQDAKLAAVNEQRYANLLKTGDTSRLTYDQQRTNAETTNAKAKAALKTYENSKNLAAQNYQGIAAAQAGLANAQTQVNIAQKAIADAVVYAPLSGSVEERTGFGGRICYAVFKDCDDCPHFSDQTFTAFAGNRSRKNQSRNGNVGIGRRLPGTKFRRTSFGNYAVARCQFAFDYYRRRIYQLGRKAETRNVRHGANLAADQRSGRFCPDFGDYHRSDDAIFESLCDRRRRGASAHCADRRTVKTITRESFRAWRKTKASLPEI